jgi:low affinity Fe/Cu permease
MKSAGLLERFAQRLTAWTGSTAAFISALTVIVVWGASGRLFHYSDTWQLVINTSTTIVTFLMVFLIQRSQNKDSLAIHLKLNELIAGLRGASNRLVNIEDLSEEELRALHRHYALLAQLAQKERPVSESHSADAAGVRHRRKSTEAEDAGRAEPA